MVTKEQETQVMRASVTLRKPDDWIVYLLEKTSPKTPDNKEATLPLGFRIEVNQPIAAVDSTTAEKLSLRRAIKSDWPRAKGVRTLVESPPLAMKEEHPEDAEIIRRLEVLAEGKS
jgi:hypothetical protein